MIETLTNQVERMMRSYFLENGGELKNPLETVAQSALNEASRVQQYRKSPTEEETAPSESALRSALEKVKGKLAEVGSPYDLSVDGETNRVVIKYQSSDNGPVTRQVPERSLLELSKKLDELTGLTIDSKS